MNSATDLNTELEAILLESELKAQAAFIGGLIAQCTREADEEASAYIRSSNYIERVARWKQIRGW